MISFEMKNCQGINEAIIEVDDHNIVRFYGENSNGKSTLSRMLEYLISGDIKNKSVRKALISDWAEHAEFAIRWNNKLLGVVLYPDIARCALLYTNDCTNKLEPVVKVGLGDAEGYRSLLSKIGLKSYAKGEVSLNISPTFAPIPLVTTTGATNFEILNDFKTDRFADEFIHTFKEVTFPAFKRRANEYRNRISELERITATDLYVGWEEDGALYVEYEEYKKHAAGIQYMDEAPVLRRPNYEEYIQMPIATVLRPVNFRLPECPTISELPFIISINNKTCPTCGRRIMEDTECITEHSI